MSSKQFNLLANKLIKSPLQRKAIELHIFGGLSAYGAENQIHGFATNTVGRDTKRLNELLEFAELVAAS
jgi:hypothetical protein